jgi:DNA-directed RNA polymerase subunit RPC12/RpoP
MMQQLCKKCGKIFPIIENEEEAIRSGFRVVQKSEDDKFKCPYCGSTDIEFATPL